MKSVTLVFLLTTATNSITATPIGGQHSAVYHEAHYRLDSAPQPSGGVYGSPVYSVVSELDDQENRNTWIGSPDTEYTRGLQYSAQNRPWLMDMGSQYWNPLNPDDGERATWMKEESPTGGTYVHLYHLIGHGVEVPPDSEIMQNEWTPYSESYQLHASLPQVYDADNGRYEGLWNQGPWQTTYGGYNSDNEGEYLTDHMDSGSLPSDIDLSGSSYPEFTPDEDTWSALGIDPDLVDLEPIEDVDAFLSQQGQENPVSGISDASGIRNPTQEGSTTYSDNVGGNTEASIGQQITWGDGISGDSIGTGEWGSTVMGVDLGSLGDGVSTSYIDSGSLTGDRGTGLEILQPIRIVMGATRPEYSGGPSDTRVEGLGVMGVPGSSLMNNNDGAEKLVGSTGNVGVTGATKQDVSGSSMLGGGLGQYGSSGVDNVIGSGGVQSGTMAGRPSVGDWFGGSTQKAGIGGPKVGDSKAPSATLFTEDKNAEPIASGSSMTGSSEPKGAESGTSSATGNVGGTGDLGTKKVKDSSVPAGGLGNNNRSSSTVKEGIVGPFDGNVKGAGVPVTSDGNANDIGALVGSSGGSVGSNIGGGTGESSKGGSAGSGASGGNGGKGRNSSEVASEAGCAGNILKFEDKECKNVVAGGTNTGGTAPKVIDSGSEHIDTINSAGERDSVGANVGNSGSVLGNGGGSGSGVASGTDTENSNITEIIQPLLVKFPDSTVAVAEAFAGIGPDGKLQASSAAQVVDSSTRIHP